ncbi:hypothetical protein M426DRAFT_68954 [Hypoxylon sp. CI-4A]|nr:hypothetical protein M426DRAFT_68954 [Hypoxylon sp. CI-4A]
MLSSIFTLVQQGISAYTGLYTGAKERCTPERVAHQLDLINHHLARSATILSVKYVKEGDGYGDKTDIPGIPPMYPEGLPDLCAVEVNVTSSATSSYHFSIFLPTTWNSKTLTVGGSGFAGFINYLDMGAGAHYGFATMSSNNGHDGDMADTQWALNSPEKQIDFAWRAMYGTVELAKQMIEIYYRKPITFSYYMGCSNGGRQGLKEIQIEPDSFDGAVIGAPSWRFSRELAWNTKISNEYYPVEDPKSLSINFISTVLAPTVAEQCDGVDGVLDGIVSSPWDCHPDFSVLSCDRPGADLDECLTPLQFETLGKIYEDYYVNSEFAYPGLGYSSETAWTTQLFSGTPTPFGLDYVRHAVYGDPEWPLEAYNDSVYEDIINHPIMHATGAEDVDMSPYRDRGGKILMYHGLSDPLISTRGSVNFYKEVQHATGTFHPIDDWFRLFLVPGLGHCMGSAVDAPWHIGGANQNWLFHNYSAWSVPGYSDPRHDILHALMEWVENGKPVEEIIATVWNNGSDFNQGVKRQRPVCAYPKKAVWDGVGDVNNPVHWKCQ